jgi:hypothetical protein
MLPRRGMIFHIAAQSKNQTSRNQSGDAVKLLFM